MTSRLFTFWNGPLTWIERLCLASQIEQGHPVTLFGYGLAERDLNVPGVVIEDARPVLPMTHEIEHLLRVSPQIVADWFRYRGLQRRLGTWIDTDMLLLKPVPPLDRLYGFEHPSRSKINNAILFLRPEDPILTDLIQFSERRPVMAPWWQGKRAFKHRLRNAIGWPIPPEDCQWGVFGPKALTHFVEVRGGGGSALPHSWFYPVPFERTADLVTDGADVTDCLVPETVGVHLWASRVRKLLAGGAPGPHSFLGRAAREGAGAVSPDPAAKTGT